MAAGSQVGGVVAQLGQFMARATGSANAAISPQVNKIIQSEIGRKALSYCSTTYSNLEARTFQCADKLRTRAIVILILSIAICILALGTTLLLGSLVALPAAALLSAAGFHFGINLLKISNCYLNASKTMNRFYEFQLTGESGGYASIAFNMQKFKQEMIAPTYGFSCFHSPINGYANSLKPPYYSFEAVRKALGAVGA